MNKLSSLFQKILSFLHVHSVVVGLDISDNLIRQVYFDGSLWQMYAMRLSPGTMQNGKLKDRDAFLAALAELRTQSKISVRDPKKINAVVTLSSVNAYSKVFRLPVIEGESLDKAIALNLEMASPSDASKVYSSSQIVGRDEATNQVDVLAAFMDRPLVDDVVDALFSAGFVAMAVEPKSLALTRVLREKGSGVDITKSYIMVSIDNAGLEFFILRNGVPYFEYVNPWRDIADEKGEVPLPVLEDDLKASLRQVLNFYAQHWTEPLAAIILSNSLSSEEIEKAVAAGFSFPVVRLTLVMGQLISSEWLFALGSSLRDTSLPALKTREISFLGEVLEDRFRTEQMVRFLEFWRAALPAAFAVLVATFFILNISLGATQVSIEHEPGFTLTSAQGQDLQRLEASSTAFNNSVAMIGSIENASVSQGAALSDINALAVANNVTISHLSIQALTSPITLTATASSEDDITAFKAALVGDPKISSVNLPLTGIQANLNNYSFSVTFSYKG